MAKTAEFAPHIARQGPYIGAFSAMAEERRNSLSLWERVRVRACAGITLTRRLRRPLLPEGEGKHPYLPRLHFQGFPGSGQVISTFAVHLDGRKCRRDLLEATDKFWNNIQYFRCFRPFL